MMLQWLTWFAHNPLSAAVLVYVAMIVGVGLYTLFEQDRANAGS